MRVNPEAVPSWSCSGDAGGKNFWGLFTFIFQLSLQNRHLSLSSLRAGEGTGKSVCLWEQDRAMLGHQRMKGICKQANTNPTLSFTPNGAGLDSFFLKMGTTQGCMFSPFLFNLAPKVLVGVRKQEKEMKDIQTNKKRSKTVSMHKLHNFLHRNFPRIYAITVTNKEVYQCPRK